MQSNQLNPETIEAMRLSVQRLKIQKVIEQSLTQAGDVLLKNLMNPDVDATIFGTKCATAISTFILKGPVEAMDIAPSAFEAALMKQGLDISDLGIARAAFAPRSSRKGWETHFAVSHTMKDARDYGHDLTRRGWCNVHRWTKGAYVLVQAERPKDLHAGISFLAENGAAQ